MRSGSGVSISWGGGTQQKTVGGAVREHATPCPSNEA